MTDPGANEQTGLSPGTQPPPDDSTTRPIEPVIGATPTPRSAPTATPPATASEPEREVAILRGGDGTVTLLGPGEAAMLRHDTVPVSALATAVDTASPAAIGGTNASPSRTPPTPGASRPQRPPPDLGTRLAGLGWLVFSGSLIWFFAGQAFASDLGTENAILRGIIRAVAVLVPAYPGALGLVALITGRRPSLQWNLLSLPYEGWWFSTLWTLTWREIKGFYGRPVAYIVLFLWLLINGVFMLILLDYYAGPESWGRDFQVPPLVYVTSHWLAIVGLGFIAPALTMRLLAEESSTGSMEMLLTSPVTDAQVALSKYLGALAFFLAMLLSIGVYMVVMRYYATEWDWGPVLSGYLGLFLLGALFLSVGLFTSSITDNQIVAFILALVPIMAMTFGVLMLKGALTIDGAREVIDHVNPWELQAQFAKGIIQWRALAFYLSSTAFFLFLTVRGVESHTWR